MNKYLPYIAILLSISTCLFAKEYLSPAELEKWFNSDDVELTPEVKVNSGELTFIDTISYKKVFHSKMHIKVDQASIDNGWVTLRQCYENLDAIQRTVIVYQKPFTKELSIESSKNIEQSNISAGHKIFLTGVKKNANLCISAKIRNFYQNEDLSFSLVNGPYHRKFLDGYYPYHLSLNVEFSPALTYRYSIPARQIGFAVKNNKNRLAIESWFKGSLKTEFRFQLNKLASQTISVNP